MLGFLFLFYFIDEIEGEHKFVFPLIYAFIGWFLHVTWLEIKPVALVYWDDALTNWATQSALIFGFVNLNSQPCSFPFSLSMSLGPWTLVTCLPLPPPSPTPLDLAGLLKKQMWSSHSGNTATETHNRSFSFAIKCSLPSWEEDPTHHWVDFTEVADGFL